MVINNSYYNGINKISKSERNITANKPQENNVSFEKILKERLEKTSEIKFSGHAQARLKMRNIQLSEEQKQKISSAIDRAQSKGVKDTLVLFEDIALIANVKNKTVVTVVNNVELKESVFTNIDGAVLA